MSVPHPIPEDLAELLARRLRVVGDATRIRVLDYLRDGEASVGDITEALGSSQQNVSKHLGLLLEAGIVGRRKDANRALYTIVDESVFRLCEEVCGSVERMLDDTRRIMEGARR